MAGPSPTKRTLDVLRERGWICQVVEYTQQSYTTHQVKQDAKQVIAAYSNKSAERQDRVGAMQKLKGSLEHYIPGKRIDLFGFIDILAMEWDGEKYTQLVGIQCTTTSNRGARVAKIKGECDEAAKAWLQCGARIEVWGWAKYKTRVEGDRRLWRESIIEITKDDYFWGPPPF